MSGYSKMVSLIFGTALVLFIFPTTSATGDKVKSSPCHYKYTKKDTIAGDIHHLKAIDPTMSSLPTLTIITREDGKQVESWWTWDEKTYNYVFFATIRPGDPPVKIHAIAQHEYDYHNKYRYYVSLNHVDKEVAMESPFISIEPTPKDFHLNKQDDEHRKDKCVIILRTQGEEGKAFKAVIKQFAHAYKMGNLLAFYVVQDGKTRPCLLIAMVNDYKVTGLVTCYPQEKNEEYPEYDDILHVEQELEFNSSPKLADLGLTKQPLVIVADSTEYAYDDEKFTEQKLNVIKVFAQENDGTEQLTSIQEIPLEHPILSIATVVTHSGTNGYLAVATDHNVLIYRYHPKTYKLLLHQEVTIENVKQVKFQEFNSNEIVLYILTTEPKNNIHVLLLKGKHWTGGCAITSSDSKFLEATSFDYDGYKRDLLISVLPKGADVYEITLKSY